MNFVDFHSPTHPALNALARTINAEARIAKVPACFLAAIVNRETGGRNIFQTGMPLGDGCGVGLTQITSGVVWNKAKMDDPTFEGYHLMDEASNLYVAAAFFIAPLIQSALRLQRDAPVSFDRFGNGQVAYYAAAGYNEGWNAVLSRFDQGIDPDGGTTDNYAKAVAAMYDAFVNEALGG